MSSRIASVLFTAPGRPGTAAGARGASGVFWDLPRRMVLTLRCPLPTLPYQANRRSHPIHPNFTFFGGDSLAVVTTLNTRLGRPYLSRPVALLSEQRRGERQRPGGSPHPDLERNQVLRG